MGHDVGMVIAGGTLAISLAAGVSVAVFPDIKGGTLGRRRKDRSGSG